MCAAKGHDMKDFLESVYDALAGHYGPDYAILSWLVLVSYSVIAALFVWIVLAMWY